MKTLTFGAIGLFTLTKYVDKYISPKYKGYMELVAIIGMAWGYVDYYKIYQLDIDQQR